MNDNPFSSPGHDEDPNAIPLEISCPVCGNEELETGCIRSSLSIFWYQDTQKPKWYQFSKSGELISGRSIHSTADVHGLRCPSCGTIVLRPPS